MPKCESSLGARRKHPSPSSRTRGRKRERERKERKSPSDEIPPLESVNCRRFRRAEPETHKHSGAAARKRKPKRDYVSAATYSRKGSRWIRDGEFNFPKGDPRPVPPQLPRHQRGERRARGGRKETENVVPLFLSLRE